MRNTMITTLSEDYVLMAEAKGLSQRRIMSAYAARNAILPNITSFALVAGLRGQRLAAHRDRLQLSGIGYALVQAVQNKDYPLIAGHVPGHHGGGARRQFPGRLAYVVLDPRVRSERG